MKKIRVMYHSKKGNTKKIAEAIAKSINVVAEAVPPAYPCENVNMLFLGGGVYGGKLDNKLKEYIRTLNSSRVKNVAVFGTSGSVDKGIEEMKVLLRDQGINVVDNSFLCKGKFFMFFNSKHPNNEDFENAKAFAKKVLDNMEI